MAFRIVEQKRKYLKKKRAHQPISLRRGVMQRLSGRSGAVCLRQID